MQSTGVRGQGSCSRRRNSLRSDLRDIGFRPNPGGNAFAQSFVPASEAEAYKREIQTIRDQANTEVREWRQLPEVAPS
jgi:hypothetical protein